MFIKVSGYNINTKINWFIYTSYDHIDTKIKNTIPLPWLRKQTYLSTNLTKHVQDLSNENNIMLIKEIKKYLNK